MNETEDIEPATALARLEATNAELRERLETAERYTAQTLLRATRLAQVIAVLAHAADFDTVVERASVEIAELFGADVAVLMLGPDDALAISGHWGVRPRDLPTGEFTVPPARGPRARPVGAGGARRRQSRPGVARRLRRTTRRLGAAVGRR